MAETTLKGVAEAGKEIQKVVGGLEMGIKLALQMGSWFIPGLSKAAAKALSAAIPFDGTGNQKADDILKIINKVL
jgi:hypothetical protein